jgi:hypothetical protein
MLCVRGQLVPRACRMVVHCLSVQGVPGAFALLNVTGVNPRQRLSLLNICCAFSQLLDVLRRQPGERLRFAVDSNAQDLGLECVVQLLACNRRGLDVCQVFVSRLSPCAEEV